MAETVHTSGIYNVFFANLMNKVIDLEADTIKVALYSDSKGFDPDATTGTYSTTNELATAGGYTQGGATLAGKAVTVGTTTGATKWDATDLAWGTTASFSAYNALIYDTSVHATDSNGIALIYFGGVQTVSTGTFTIVWNSAGIITLND